MIDFDAIADLDAPYEPWQPKVGDRVRVRLNPECKADCHDTPVPSGVTGRVVANPPLYAAHWLDHYPDHRYPVMYDSPPLLRDSEGQLRHYEGCGYAACELEPIKEPETMQNNPSWDDA